jgi:hypothetical protein
MLRRYVRRRCHVWGCHVLGSGDTLRRYVMRRSRFRSRFVNGRMPRNRLCESGARLRMGRRVHR